MQTISREDYAAWCKDSQTIEQDAHGEKVVRLADGTFLKLFRRKSWLSKSAIYPQAKRFADNAQSLRQLGIPCPDVIAVYRMNGPYRSIVHYDPLRGDTLRYLLKIDPANDQRKLLERLAVFVNQLHDQGVYFRSLHMGNIVLTQDDQLGLIDISDMRFFGRPLSRWMRNRNYRHLLRYDSDWGHVSQEFKQLFGTNAP